MTRKTGLLLAGAIVALVLASFLVEREGMKVPRVRTDSVRISGDTVPAGVPDEIAELLEEGRSWRAARALRTYVAQNPNASAETRLLAARAEAESGSWNRAQEALEGQPWLDEVWGGEGWYWLARAQEENGEHSAALDSYDRYLSLQEGREESERAGVAELRRGLVLLRLGRREEGAEALQGVEEYGAAVQEWVGVLAAEALAETGDTAATSAAVVEAPDGTIMKHRARLADVRAFEEAGDLRGAFERASQYRRSGGSPAERAQLAKEAGRLALELDDVEAARRELAAAMEISAGSAGARDAANLYRELPDLTAEERLTIAGIYERHGNAARAAEGFRAWLSQAPASAPNRDQVRLRLGRALFNAGELASAEETLRPLFDASSSIAREAMLLTGRAEYRRGARSAAFRTFERLAERFPGSVEGSEGLFLVGDLNHDNQEVATASRVYRKVADNFQATDRAGLSLMRLGGLRFGAGDYAGAAAIWEEYRARYPRGERWLESTYWAGRSYEEAGDRARSESLYRAVSERDPLSYYALLAANRLGRQYWPVPMTAAPPVDSAAVAVVDEWMAAVDILREAGLHSEADNEAQRLADTAPANTSILYSLAEALNERGYAIRGIRIGQRLEQLGERRNPRLLRILYPFPYRELIAAEAREAGLDPFVVAGLTRQESLFTRRISSPVGARGLMQVMPETGAALARGVGIDEWDAELLYNPEINVHLGIRYLAEQMRKYDGSLPSVFSAYNAGPHRIDVWKEFPEYDDEELFTERIPYRETRDYVKILTRNIAIYRGLYGTQATGSQPDAP